MDKLSDIKLFLLVAEEGSFAGAARKAGVSATVATRRISALEEDLQTRLLNRSTRNVSLTEAGQIFRERALEVVGAADRAQDALEELQGNPRGTLQVSASPTIAPILLGLMPDFYELYPDIRLLFNFTEAYVDLVKEGFDLAIRVGHPSDSSLIARELILSDSMLCASPAYLKKWGIPRHPRELNEHQCLTLKNKIWKFSKGGEQFSVPVTGNVKTDVGSLAIIAARAGAGITMMPDWALKDDLTNGSLVRILEDFQIEPKGTPVNAVYPARTHLPPKVRVLIEFLKDALSSYMKV